MRIFGGIMAWIEEVVKVKLSCTEKKNPPSHSSKGKGIFG